LTKLDTVLVIPVVARDIPEPIVFATFVTALTAAVIGDPMAMEVIFLFGLGGDKFSGLNSVGISGLVGIGTAPRAKKANIP
jgi:hypothetical protein